MTRTLRLRRLFVGFALVLGSSCAAETPMAQADPGKPQLIRTSKPSEATLKKELTSMQFEVTQRSGTEPAFTNAMHKHKAPGLYVDITTGQPLFSSLEKFDSGTGWPSFWKPLTPDVVVEVKDREHGMERIEIRSKIGDAHLGHVFDDGPKPTGLRYCINGASLRFIPAADLEAQGYGAYRSRFATPTAK